jgi:hypothetical protein
MPKVPDEAKIPPPIPPGFGLKTALSSGAGGLLPAWPCSGRLRTEDG